LSVIFSSVNLRIARFKKPHTIAKELILPATVDMCEVVQGKKYGQKLSFGYAILIRHVLAQPGVPYERLKPVRLGSSGPPPELGIYMWSTA